MLTAQSGEKVKVRLLRYLGEVTGDSTVDAPPTGKIHVGVQVQLTNVGQARVDEVPGNDGKVITTNGEQSENTTLSGGVCSSSAFDAGVKLTPGDSIQGCIPFDVPASSHVQKFQYTLNSGYADQTAEWKVR